MKLTARSFLRQIRKVHVPVLCLVLCSLGLTPFNLLITTVSAAHAEGVRITVLDSSDRAIVGAVITVKGSTLVTAKNFTTDGQGNAILDGLAPGTYLINVSASGFKDASQSLTIKSDGTTDLLKIKLEVAPTEQVVPVPGAANVADSVYTQLRTGSQGALLSATVENLQFTRDVGSFVLTKGKLYLLPMVMDHPLQAVFVGEGKFSLIPTFWVEKKFLKAVTQSESLSEDFGQLYLHASDGILEEWKKKLNFTPETGTPIKDLIEAHHTLLRKTLPQYGVSELRGNNNFDALELGTLYWPQQPGYFHAFIKGNKTKSLWFAVDRLGFLPSIGPEEVGLLNYDENDFSLLYHAHLKEEYDNGKAVSSSDHNIIDVTNYQIESVLNKETIRATAEITFQNKVSGPRVLTFGLEPKLRVSKVTDAQGNAIPFIQENEKSDGSLNIILPKPLQAGTEGKIKVAYEGKGVINDAGGGNYFVGLRTSWYPSYGTFKDYAMYDMTFKSPKKFTLVATGKLVKESQEGDYKVTTWTSPHPMVVAGFNFANYKKKSVKDQGVDIDVYATEEVPDFLKIHESPPERDEFGSPTASGAADRPPVGELTPTRLANTTLAQTQNALRLYNIFFGEYPYGQIAISQQPASTFGQAWPMLVYLPITAFLDKTQLYFLTRTTAFGKFIDVVGPHEMAHQWWGHLVVWSSYHDQWLSEGFADFSAALYLEQVISRKRAMEFWDEERRLILEKNNFGLAPGDVGPLWMGLRLALGRKSGDIYRRTVYPKGAYVLYMLRRMMWDPKTGDQAFIDMMKDFTKTYQFKRASTEDFKAIAENHITPSMDLQGNKKLDWFFVNWVYGTDIPEYSSTLTASDAGGGKIQISGSVSQRNVQGNFAMLVPLYAEMDDGKILFLGRLQLIGNQTQNVNATVNMPQKPKRILINAFNDVLCIMK